MYEFAASSSNSVAMSSSLTTSGWVQGSHMVLVYVSIMAAKLDFSKNNSGKLFEIMICIEEGLYQWKCYPYFVFLSTSWVLYMYIYLKVI